ncbi:MAG: GNAT family N-acetyltransferase [Sutterellaceae bacterium]|nr:GNAT family N-acetyltransferase [Burkholderiaceae bacterium]MCX7902358.1 GNAT family N-acetyltransferase [Burkholderiaceae bacterium]MDW8430989.1 GNAT family N-acetyltransferase [Sutterellaceae bacterium]
MIRWACQPIDHLRVLAADWDRLAVETAPHAPFLRTAFVLPLLNHFGTGQERVLLAREGTQLVAMAVVQKTTFATWQTFQPSQAPLGAFVVRRGSDWGRLLPGALAALPGLALSLGITQQDPLVIPRPADSGRLHTLDYIETAWIDLDGTFTAYWERRGKNLRHNIRRQHAKLAEQRIAMRLETLTAATDVLPALQDYGRLESAGWKGKAGTAIRVDNLQGRFYRDMLEAFCAQGRGRIYRLWFDNRVVAVDLCIESDDTLVILKTTYDETVGHGLSPAVLLLHAALEALYREGRIKRLEFYGKLMDWHRRWTDRTRQLYHINHDRWHWLRRMRASWRAWRSSRRGPVTEAAPQASQF